MAFYFQGIDNKLYMKAQIETKKNIHNLLRTFKSTQNGVKQAVISSIKFKQKLGAKFPELIMSVALFNKISWRWERRVKKEVKR